MTDPTQPIGPTPNDPANGTQPDTLRDARLAKALQHMPDAYLDHAATTPMRPEAVAAMAAFLPLV